MNDESMEGKLAYSFKWLLNISQSKVSIAAGGAEIVALRPEGIFRITGDEKAAISYSTTVLCCSTSEKRHGFHHCGTFVAGMTGVKALPEDSLASELIHSWPAERKVGESVPQDRDTDENGQHPKVGYYSDASHHHNLSS